MKVHVCRNGGYLHDDLDPKAEAAWLRLPEELREALVRADQRVSDLEEREGWGSEDTPRGRELAAAKERAVAALAAHPASHGVSKNPEWFRLFALVESRARSDRCPMCYRRVNEQLTLAVPPDPSLPQDPPPPRPAAALPPPAEPRPEARTSPAKPPPRPAPAARREPPWAPRPAEVLPTGDAARIASEALKALKAGRGPG